MDASTINVNTVQLRPIVVNSSATIDAQVSYDSVNKLVSLNPTSPLDYSTGYRATISGIKNENGTTMASDYSWTFTTMDQTVDDGNRSFIGRWGALGPGNGQFNVPAKTAIDSDENLDVVDIANDRIQKFASDGTFIKSWGRTGAANGQFNEPQDVATDSDGNVYVTDIINNRVQKFDSNGTFMTGWGTTSTVPG